MIQLPIMAKEKRSFFERLTGTIRMSDDSDSPEEKNQKKALSRGGNPDLETWIDQEIEQDAELTIDVYHNPETVIIKSMIAGVRPEDLDISITRDTVIIRGHREEERIAREEDYLARELYWGSFSRTISLPEEIDVDGAEAIEKHGLLILKLPKLDKKRQSKLKVKTG
jgi:HSP20 family molecular chaperone IbpA